MQFTSGSLARLISQVEREILVEAFEEAGMTSILTTDALETLKEVAGWLNFIENMLILGPAAAEAGLKSILEGMPRPVNAIAAGNAFSVILDLFRFVPGIGALDDKLEQVIDALSRLTQPEGFNRDMVVRDLTLIEGLAREIQSADITKERMIGRAGDIRFILMSLARLLGIRSTEFTQ